MDLILPYKVGDLAEYMCFVEGYRGAWFRCKIIATRVTESGHYECYLEYPDYPSEDKEWVRLFQKNPAYPEQQTSYQIMIRPSFPQWYWKDEVPEQLPNNDDIAIVDETWKVGDKVDWLSEGSYWSAKITKLHNEDMVEVELFEPPIGEGQCYDANRNDLRPTLDWDLVDGWSVPLSQKEKSWHVVRVIHRISVETSDSGEETSSDDGDKGDNSGDGQDVQLQFLEANTSLEAPASLIPKPSSAATSDGVQPAVTSSQPGIGIILQERGMGSSIEQDQAGNVQGLDEIVGKLKELLERTLAMESRAARLVPSVGLRMMLQ